LDRKAVPELSHSVYQKYRVADFTTAAQPNGDESPRHKNPAHISNPGNDKDHPKVAFAW